MNNTTTELSTSQRRKLVREYLIPFAIAIAVIVGASVLLLPVAETLVQMAYPQSQIDFH